MRKQSLTWLLAQGNYSAKNSKEQGLFQKKYKQWTGTIDDMEITGALKKEHRELPTFNYERSKIPWVFSEKFLCGISMGLGF